MARQGLIDSAQRQEGRLRLYDWLASVRTDARFALRQLARARRFALLTS